jgi:HD-GYP domain-containing protein (c-di-GMP phosphodiesterase class II)
MTGIVRAIINAIDAKDQYTCGHSDRVAAYAKCIAERLGEDPEECERIYMAGLLHDVGKIGVPDSILGKPGKLTDEEYAVVKKHPEIGYSILKHLKQLDYVLPGVLHHHEAIDGSGYPAGLIGDSIPFAGRLLAVADAYDAMTSDRPYRRGMPTERAESILQSEAGTTWDARIVAALMECLECGTIKVPSSYTSPHPPITFADPTSANHPLMNRIALSINSIATV